MAIPNFFDQVSMVFTSIYEIPTKWCALAQNDAEFFDTLCPRLMPGALLDKIFDR